MDTPFLSEASARLLKAAAETMSPQGVLDEAFAILGLPIALNSVTFQGIATAGDSLLPRGDMERNDHDSPRDRREWMRRMHGSTEPVIDDYEKNPRRVMCFDVKAKATEVGKLSMVEIRPFRDEDAEILKRVAQALAPLLFTTESIAPAEEMRQVNLLEHLITGELNLSRLENGLMSCHITDGEPRRLLVLCDENHDDASYPLLTRLCRERFGFYAAHVQGVLAALLPEAFGLAELAPLLTDYALLGGVSRVFTQLAQTRAHFLQAMAALDFAAASERLIPYGRVFLTDVVRHFAQEEGAAQCCRPEIRALSDYDREHGTDHLKTLKCYLEHGCNIAETAKAMFFHYNTVKYRVHGLLEVMGMERIDPLDASELLISVLLTEHTSRNAAPTAEPLS